MPDATLRAVGNRRELAIWSEMISDGVMALERAGARADTPDRVLDSCSAPRARTAWVDQNPRLRMNTHRDHERPVTDRSTAKNGLDQHGAQVDIADQAGASHITRRLYSGFGGQPDFVTGALHSPGGHAIIALRSWHEPSDTSTIVHG